MQARRVLALVPLSSNVLQQVAPLRACERPEETLALKLITAVQAALNASIRGPNSTQGEPLSSIGAVCPGSLSCKVPLRRGRFLAGRYSPTC